MRNYKVWRDDNTEDTAVEVEASTALEAVKKYWYEATALMNAFSEGYSETIYFSVRHLKSKRIFSCIIRPETVYHYELLT